MAKLLEPGPKTAKNALLLEKEREYSPNANGLDGGRVLNQLDISSEDPRSALCGERPISKEQYAEIRVT
jgi:hypothetical protein